MQSESSHHLHRPAGPPPPLPPENRLPCPRCNSTLTKFCYYNNYNLSQPRHFCKSCRRYWTHGGALRDIPARHDPPKRPRRRSSQLTPPPQCSPPDLHLGAPGSFTGLLNSPGHGLSALDYDFGSDVDVVGDGGAWQIGIGGDVELVDCSGFTWPDLTIHELATHYIWTAVHCQCSQDKIFSFAKHSAMGDIDPAFIQSIEHRPILAFIEPGEVPVIDLTAMDGGAVDPLVAEIGKACEEWGFFQVINHGVPADLVRRIEAAAKEFFGQSSEEKRKVKRDEKNAMGYHDAEHTKNVRDWKEVLDIAVEDPLVTSASPDPEDEELTKYYNRWPEYPPDFRELCEEYVEEMEKLGYKLLELVSLSLGLVGDRLKEFFKGQTSIIRLNHYPPCPRPELALGVGRHKDAGALTILYQDGVGGLEVKRKRDGEWVGVKPITDAYIINVGDAMQVWSNDRYESVEHRVVVKGDQERYSIPFFFFPGHHVTVKPLEELVNEQNPPRFNEYNWGKFMANRNRSDFKKQAVENIQIHHFRVSP